MCKGELFKRRAKDSQSGNPSDLLEEVILLNPQQCAVRCESKTSCISFSYNPYNGKCQLYSKVASDLTIEPAAGFTIYEKVSRK